MLLEINFTTVLFAISFLVFIYLLNLTLYKPAGEIIEKRKKLINDAYKVAKEFTDEAQKKLEEYKKQIKSARIEAQGIIQQTINNTNKTREEKISALVTELLKEKEIAIKQIQIEKEKSLKEIETKVKALTELITNKILDVEEKTLVKSH